MTTLPQLLVDIDARVQSIRENRPDWLCGKGCDGCCKRLAEVPQLTAEEWSLLREGLAVLPSERIGEISREMSILTDHESGPVICPLLDRATGACSVYVQRPAACRTYGFYVQRDKGLYCREIEIRVDEGALTDVVWGNHDAIDLQLNSLGKTRALTEWFGLWDNEE